MNKNNNHNGLIFNAKNGSASSNEVYEAALKPGDGFAKRLLTILKLVVGLGALIAFAWAEPFSGMLFSKLLAAGTPEWMISFVLLPVVMVLRAVLLVESVGYAYHRFFQHVGFLTRRAYVFRRNQKFHWIHHMIIYPIGRFYKRPIAYVSSEKGLGLSWVLPGVIVAALFVLAHGISLATLAFIAGVGLYAKFVVDLTHSRFHEADHPWVSKRYFHWLEEIHLLHHWDQRMNFTIVHPLMDQLFGTYMAPATHQRELEVCMKDEDLTVSDVINWRYLLIEASPAEYAAFVSSAKNHPRGVKKLQGLLKILNDRLTAHPGDAHAKVLKVKAEDLLKTIGKFHPPTP